ncbi:MAG: rhodanese-like domain-containing protein [Ignavibacteriales bacterium]|nr:rhodanese-like domain-containing protein [Ignavibacteriales bacterium]
MNDVINLSAPDFSDKIINDNSAVIIDVRTPQEFNDGHIPNSLLIDIYNPTFSEKITKLDKEKKYYIYCRSGNRSYYAGVFMLEQGFTNVHHLEEGILSWTEKLEK